MTLISWLLKKIKKPVAEDSSMKNGIPDLVIQFGSTSHVVSDEEFKVIKAERKQQAKEWRALGRDEQNRRLAEKFRIKRQEDRARVKDLGITHYKWRTAGPCSNSCEECMKNEGKIFAWNKPSKIGHPGDHHCGPYGYCLCLAISIVPGFED